MRPAKPRELGYEWTASDPRRPSNVGRALVLCDGRAVWRDVVQDRGDGGGVLIATQVGEDWPAHWRWIAWPT